MTEAKSSLLVPGTSGNMTKKGVVAKNLKKCLTSRGRWSKYGFVSQVEDFKWWQWVKVKLPQERHDQAGKASNTRRPSTPVRQPNSWRRPPWTKRSVGYWFTIWFAQEFVDSANNEVAEQELGTQRKKQVQLVSTIMPWHRGAWLSGLKSCRYHKKKSTTSDTAQACCSPAQIHSFSVSWLVASKADTTLGKD